MSANKDIEEHFECLCLNMFYDYSLKTENKEVIFINIVSLLHIYIAIVFLCEFSLDASS